MRVKVTYTEVQYFETQKNIEMTKKEYKEYLKTGRVNFDLEAELSSECSIENWRETEYLSTDVEIITN